MSLAAYVLYSEDEETLKEEQHCTKIPYPDEFVARFMMHKFMESKKFVPQVGKRIEIYFCSECIAWHWGHTAMNQTPYRN